MARCRPTLTPGPSTPASRSPPSTDRTPFTSSAATRCHRGFRAARSTTRWSVRRPDRANVVSSREASRHGARRPHRRRLRTHRPVTLQPVPDEMSSATCRQADDFTGVITPIKLACTTIDLPQRLIRSTAAIASPIVSGSGREVPISIAEGHGSKVAVIRTAISSVASEGFASSWRR